MQQTDRRGFLKVLGFGAAAAVVKPELIPIDRYAIDEPPVAPGVVEGVLRTRHGSELGSNWTTVSTTAAPMEFMGDFSKFILRDAEKVELAYV